METWIGILPKINNALYFSNRLNIIDNPTISLEPEYYHVLIHALLQDRLISYREQNILYNILPENEKITLKLLEAISPSPLYLIFRYLRRFFRSDNKLSLYNPLIPGIIHTSLLPVLYSIISTKEKINNNIDTIILDNAELFSYEEIISVKYVTSIVGAKLILVTNTPKKDILEISEKIVLSPSFSIKTLERILGINIQDLFKELKIKVEENQTITISKGKDTASPIIVKKPEKIDYLSIAFKEEKSQVYDLLSEIYSGGLTISLATLNSFLETRKISLTLYDKIVKYGFLEVIKGTTGVQVFLTPKAYYVLENSKFFK